ncbi:hypothetical protein X425_02360 [Mycobacterium avium XTB13-223]|nr:hypothetical protein X425_02360 [Mycobacterium avium XTB13-223]
MRPADHPLLVLVAGWTAVVVLMGAILATILGRF